MANVYRCDEKQRLAAGKKDLSDKEQGNCSLPPIPSPLPLRQRQRDMDTKQCDLRQEQLKYYLFHPPLSS